MASKAEAKVSTDHDEIREWAEKRGGQPACVKGTGDTGDVGLLRLDFPGYSGEDSLQHITWEEFFEKFDERGLALLHQEETAGGAQSNFNKLINRTTAAPAKSSGRKRPAAKKTTAKKTAAKKAPAKKAPGKKVPAKKTAAKKTAGKKTPAKKAPAKKASARKAATKRRR